MKSEDVQVVSSNLPARMQLSLYGNGVIMFADCLSFWDAFPSEIIRTDLGEILHRYIGGGIV